MRRAGAWVELSVRARRRTARRRRSRRSELAAGLAGADPRSAAAARAARAGRRRRTRDLLSRRDASFAPVQEYYYRNPPQIERGRRHYLMSTAGRSYLDMVNNVTVLGHAHPRDRRHRGPAAAQAEHELAVQLRGGGRVQRAAGRHSARSAGHGVSGQLRLGGKRSGDPAGDGRDGSARRGRGPRGLSRLDVRHRCGVDVDRRQPQCACHPAGLGAHGRVAEQLPRQVPRRRVMQVRRRGGAADRGAGRRRAGRPRRSSARACTATRAAWRCRMATCSRCTRRCGPAAVSRSPTRCRSVTAVSANGSGVFSSRTWCPTSCRSRSRRATAIRWAR